MKWYDNIQFEQPKYLDDMKTTIENREKFIEKKKEITNRLLKARAFFMTDNISKKDLQRANELLIDITNQLLQVEEIISNLDKELISILEKKSLNISMSVTKNDFTNDIGENIEGFKMDSSSISPSDVFLFKAIKDLFNIDDNNIEFK